MIKIAKNAWKKKNLNCEFIRFKNGRLNYKCKECKRSYTKLTNESIKNFPTLHKFWNRDLNNFFPYEYIESMRKFNENIIPPEKAF